MKLVQERARSLRRSKRCYRTISEYCAYKNAGRSCFSSLEKLWRKGNLKFRCAAAEKTRTKRQYFACVRTSCFPYPTSNRKSQHFASYLWQLLDSASVSAPCRQSFSIPTMFTFGNVFIFIAPSERIPRRRVVCLKLVPYT